VSLKDGEPPGEKCGRIEKRGERVQRRGKFVKGEKTRDREKIQDTKRKFRKKKCRQGGKKGPSKGKGRTNVKRVGGGEREIKRVLKMIRKRGLGGGGGGPSGARTPHLHTKEGDCKRNDPNLHEAELRWEGGVLCERKKKRAKTTKDVHESKIKREKPYPYYRKKKKKNPRKKSKNNVDIYKGERTLWKGILGGGKFLNISKGEVRKQVL